MARHAHRFAERPGQQQMAAAVAQTIEAASILVVEAGTGVGKTYAYLAPALLSGRRTLISTATKALQDQLFARDLPAVCRALGVPVRTALLKGRSSYLCLHRLEQARHALAPHEHLLQHGLARVETWAQHTRTGDLSELSGLDEQSPLWPLVSSTRENCLGAQCPSFRSCHVNLARREALAADVVVINHHLFFADVAVRESGVAELLPSAELVVFDEAHQLNEIGVQFLGVMLSSGQVQDLARDLRVVGLQWARGQGDWPELAHALEHASQEMRLCVEVPGARMGAGGGKRRWLTEAPEGLSTERWTAALSALRAALTSTSDALEVVRAHAPDLQRLAERTAALCERLQRVCASHNDQPMARWTDTSGHGWRLVLTPLHIGQAFQERVLVREAAPPCAWVFTSATLGTDEAMSWFTRPLGLTQARTLRVPSPFDYPSQAALYVPTDLPVPSDPAHPDAVAQAVWAWAQRLGGRTLVLATTLRAMRRMAQAMSAWAADSSATPPLQVLVQGQSPKRELLQRFERAALPGAPGAVLIASASFWEGVDVPGDSLQLVVIDKLPFPPPDDPLVEARTRAMEAEGAKPFTAYFLPEAAVALKQGAGRLIRSEHDRGVLVVCDVRLRKMGYGRKLLAGLPAMRTVEDGQAMWRELDALLTTASTMPTHAA